MAKILMTIDLDQQYIGQITSKGHSIINNTVTREELKELIKEIDCLIVGYDTVVDREMIDEALKTGKLKIIIRAGETIDNIDVHYATKNNIKVYHTPGAATNAVAELVIAQMINTARHVQLANEDIRKGIWDRSLYYGTEISRKTLGLIGFGRVSRAVAEKAKSLSMRIIYFDKKNITELYGYDPVSMDELLTEADYISVHIPKTEDNYHTITDRTFEIMKDGVIFLNHSSGYVLDTEALLSAMESGKVKAAALDVFEKEPVTDERILNNKNIFLTPHIGSSTVEAKIRISQQVVKYVIENL